MEIADSNHKMKPRKGHKTPIFEDVKFESEVYKNTMQIWEAFDDQMELICPDFSIQKDITLYGNMNTLVYGTMVFQISKCTPEHRIGKSLPCHDDDKINDFVN